MIRALVEQTFDQYKKYLVLAGTSEDAKPTAGLITGSKFLEVDTGTEYAFDEASSEWTATDLTPEEAKAAIAAEVSDWLDDHPEATTTVEDGAITYAKLDSSLQGSIDDVGSLKSALFASTSVLAGSTNIVPDVLPKGYWNNDGSTGGSSSNYYRRSRDMIPIPDGVYYIECSVTGYDYYAIVWEKSGDVYTRVDGTAMVTDPCYMRGGANRYLGLTFHKETGGVDSDTIKAALKIQKLVDSGDLKATVDANVRITDATTDAEEIVLVKNYYLKPEDGKLDVENPVASTGGYAYGITPCVPGDRFLVNGNSYNGTYPLAWYFLDAEYNILYQAEQNITVVNKLLTAPDGASYFVVHTLDPWPASYKGKDIGPMYPQLTDAQKTAMQALADAYYAKRDSFTYLSSATMNSYASTAAIDSETNKYKICCSLLACLLWMGRSADDFPEIGGGTTYTNAVTPATGFDFGYYFQFAERHLHDMKPEDGYFGFYNQFDDPDYAGSYSWNSYYSASSSAQYHQRMNQFMYANDMAKELDRLGYSIPVSELQTGDLIFASYPAFDPKVDTFDAIAYKHINHVAIVYEKTPTSITIIESTPRFDDPIHISSSTGTDEEKVRIAYLLGNAVCCARHPAAFGDVTKVPANITTRN